MSEYQYVAFRAIDGPVSEENLEFMREQSTRAEITPWSFDNEYHYGDFRGKTLEMLRRGYDFYFHYANFGTRTLMFRFPEGLPDPKATKPYFEGEGCEFIKDKRGPGGSLLFDPAYEPGELDDMWCFDDYLPDLQELRAELLDGDLRPLYLARLAVQRDLNHDLYEPEPPVPAGLDKLTQSQKVLAEFYGLSETLIATAAKLSLKLPRRKKATSGYASWLKKQPAARKNEWLARLMEDPNASVRRELLSEYRKSTGGGTWPTVDSKRTIAELLREAGELED